jgi:hypothetical protein
VSGIIQLFGNCCGPGQASGRWRSFKATLTTIPQAKETRGESQVSDRAGFAAFEFPHGLPGSLEIRLKCIAMNRDTVSSMVINPIPSRVARPGRQ